MPIAEACLTFFPPFRRGDRGGFFDCPRTYPNPHLVKEGSPKQQYHFLETVLVTDFRKRYWSPSLGNGSGHRQECQLRAIAKV